MCRSARTRRTAARVAGAFALTSVAAVLLASAASAASSITVSPSSAPRGSTVTSGDPAQLTSTADLFPPDGLGPQAPRDAIGNFNITYTIPPTASSGAHSIGVRCGGGAVGVSAALQVTQTPTTTGVAPTTTSSTSTSVVTVAPTTTAPRATTTTPRAAPARKSSSRAVWIVLGALALLLAAGAAVLFFRRRGAGGSD